MSQILSPSLARCYGMTRVARVWKISRASVYRALKETPPNTSGRRPGSGGHAETPLPRSPPGGPATAPGTPPMRLRAAPLARKDAPTADLRQEPLAAAL